MNIGRTHLPTIMKMPLYSAKLFPKVKTIFNELNKMHIILEYEEIVKKTEKMIVDCKENIKNCIENKYKEMAEQIEENVDIIWKFNKNEMLYQLRNEYTVKIKKFANLI